MFSLPTILPRDSHPLYHPSSSSYNHHNHHHHHQQTHTATTAPSDPRQPPHPQSQHPNPPHSTPPFRTPLTVLAADEAVIAYRKRALARYGATWLRPPGVTKTLQGRDDERAEREEAEAQREREARAEEEMMRAQELADAQQDEMEGEEGEEVEDGVDLDADVPDGDGDVGEEWSDEEEEEEEEEEDVDNEDEEDDQGEVRRQMPGGMRAALGGGAGMGTAAAAVGMDTGLFDGPATPLNDDRTPQRFRLNPFQAPTAEGDGDYGSPLAARHSHRAAAARARDVSPGVMAAAAVRRGHVDAGTRRAVQGGGGRAAAASAAATAAASTNIAVIDMEADLDDAIPMDETMMEGGSYEHTDTELEDLSSEDERSPAAGMAGVGSRSVFGGGGIAAAVRRISGQERRASGAARRVSGGERRVSGGERRVSGGGGGGAARRSSARGRGHVGREN